MDILKLLSRSTKQSHNSAAERERISIKLPSAGEPSNPQLYHDAASEFRGTKRKREAREAMEWQVQEQEDQSPNYFRAVANTARPKKTAAASEAFQKTAALQEVSQTNSNLLDEGGCRQVLRSHRLKFTILPSVNNSNKGAEKSSKKVQDSNKSGSRKDGLKQLYPQPLLAFDNLRTTYGISGRLEENLAHQGYKLPTEVQMGSLPLLLQPKTALGAAAAELGISGTEKAVDLLAVAPTGSGKTLAFLIPVLNSIMQRRRTCEHKESHILEAIVVAPTKELANQILNEAKKLSIGTGIKLLGMRKGLRIAAGDASDERENISSEEDGQEAVNTESRTSQALAKADILITTPLVLLHALSTSSQEEHMPLPTVQSLVLDEADVLLDPLFREQTLGIWKCCTNTSLRVTIWSATMGSSIEALVSSTMQSRKSRLGLFTPSRIIRLVVGLKDSAIPNITHRLTYAATEPGKLIALRQLLHPTSKSKGDSQSLRPPFLVFTQTIPRAIALHSELLYDIPAEAGGSSRIAVLHSDLSDNARDHVMSRFRNGEIWILITTDILSRGVDFRGVNGVVNYDVPNSGAAYVHRVGRTGRAGRDGGVAITLYTKEDIPYVKNVANIIAASEKQAGKSPSEGSIQKWLLDALPNPTKEEKRKLKMYGVEARRSGLGKKKEAKDVKGQKGRMQISTKSGYERKLANNKKGAIQGSRRRMQEAKGGQEMEEQDSDEDSEWGGIHE